MDWELFEKERNKMKKKIVCLLMASVFLFVMGCASFVINTYKTEYVTGSAYNLAAINIKNLNASGKITPDQLVKIYQYGSKFYNSYQVSVDALIVYYKVPDSSVESIVNASLISLFANWGDLVELVNSIIPGTLSQPLRFSGTTTGGQKYTVTVKKLDNGQIQIIIQIGAVILQYAIQEGMEIIQALQKSDITIDDLMALKTMIKPLDQY